MKLYNIRHNNRFNQGFTLIELMIVMVVIAILAAVAIPGYSSYIKKNAEATAKTNVLGLANDLEKWRAKALSYKGFDTDRLDNTNGSFYLPKGSTSADYDYKVTVKGVKISGGNTTTSVGVLKAGTAGQGKFWRIIAIPNPTSSRVEYAREFYMDSLGSKCSFAYSTTITLNTDKLCIDTGFLEW